MDHGQFIWADLSTFRPQVTERFYSDLFGWEVSEGLATKNGQAVAHLYEMPAKFQKIGMPSFWMSYIAVSSVADAVSTAQSQGGKVELGPEPFEQGQIALIRDPLGAGFTVYEGPSLGETATGLDGVRGARVGHGLFVSDASAVAAFYEALFGWHFGPAKDGVQSVSLNGQHLFFCHSIPDPNVRGKEEYWAVYFSAPDLGLLAATVAQAGGQVVAQTQLPEGPALIAQDPDGGTFFALASEARENVATNAPATPWRAWAGLGLVLLSAFTNALWPWAIFLAAWIWSALRSGETYLFEAVRLKAHPTLFWTLIAVYAGLLILVLGLELGVIEDV